MAISQPDYDLWRASSLGQECPLTLHSGAYAYAH